jgi:hypothetical protein
MKGEAEAEEASRRWHEKEPGKTRGEAVAELLHAKNLNRLRWARLRGNRL